VLGARAEGDNGGGLGESGKDHVKKKKSKKNKGGGGKKYMNEES